MWYPNSDATGMTFIARCLDTIRGILINMPDNQLTTKLKEVAVQKHNLELLNYRASGTKGKYNTPQKILLNSWPKDLVQEY